VIGSPSPNVSRLVKYQIKIVNVVFILALPPRKGRSSLGIGSTKERFRQWITLAWADCPSVLRIRRLLEPSFSNLLMLRRVRTRSCCSAKK
jgi:hypothetical protein